MTPEQMLALQNAGRLPFTVLSTQVQADAAAITPPSFLQRWGLPIAAGAGAFLVGLGVAYAAR